MNFHSLREVTMKKHFSIFFFIFSFLILAGCDDTFPAEVISEEPVKLEWYVNFSWYNTPWGCNAVSKVITEKTGADISFISPDGSESETLDALISGNSLPDIITLCWWETQLSVIIDHGLVFPLNRLAEEYDEYFFEVADPDRLAWYTQEDGNVYCYPNSSFSIKDYESGQGAVSNQTFLVRKDIYEAIGSPNMTTAEGFENAVRAAAEAFPEVDGKPLIPVGAHEFTTIGCDSFDKFLMNFLAVPYEKNGEFYDRYTDPEYKRWLSMFRKLGEEGLLSSDIFIDKRTQMEEKIKDGRYFCMIYQRTDIADIERLIYEADPDSVYIAVDGPRNESGDPHTLPGTGINGWTVTLISKNCEHPDLAIKLMSYLMSEEGQKLIALGIEGEHYNMENGRAVLTEETKKLLGENRLGYIETVGANDSYWMLQDNRMQNKWMPKDVPPLVQMEEWAKPYTFYSGQCDVRFIPGTEEYAAHQRISSIHGEMLPKLLLAPSEEEFEELWDIYVQKREDGGLALVLEESTKQMNALKARLGIS